MNLEKISLRKVIPRVFMGEESEKAFLASEIWNKDLDFVRGGRYLVEAASGQGKSSLCSFLFGERIDYVGQILFDDKDCRNFNINRWCAIRKLNIAYLPQNSDLFPELTVMENLILKNQLTKYRSQSEILDMLEAMDIAWKATQPARLLSVGQQQRVALVRALCQPFDFLIVDEPVSHLDHENNLRASALIQNEITRSGAAVIVTSVGNRLILDGMTILRL